MPAALPPGIPTEPAPQTTPVDVLREAHGHRPPATPPAATSPVIDVAVADLEAAKEHGWQVVRPDAYPEVFHKEVGLSLRPPLAWELELMEGCLRAVPEFVARYPQDDPAQEEMTVPVASGPLKPASSWVVEEAV